MLHVLCQVIAPVKKHLAAWSCRADQDRSSLGETCELEPRIHCDSKRSCSDRGATASGERLVKMSSGMSSGPTRHPCRVGSTQQHTYTPKAHCPPSPEALLLDARCSYFRRGCHEVAMKRSCAYRRAHVRRENRGMQRLVKPCIPNRERTAKSR